MKKLGVLFLLIFLMQLCSPVYAAFWKVEVLSDKNSYELQEEAVFNIEVTKNGRLIKEKEFVVESFFPDSGSLVSLMPLTDGKYEFKVTLEALLKTQTLHVQIQRMGKNEIILAEGVKAIDVLTYYDNSFNIQEGMYTNSSEINLRIDSVSFYELLISESPLFLDSHWQPYASVIPFSISAGDGEKTIYVKFRHKITQEEQLENAKITLDTIAPVISTLSPADGSVVSGK